MSCPSCKSVNTVNGELGGEGPIAHFFPEGLRLLTVHRAVRLAGGHQFTACRDCGLLWNSVEPGALQELLEKSGKSV
jgi:hypothetical protein